MEFPKYIENSEFDLNFKGKLVYHIIMVINNEPLGHKAILNSVNLQLHYHWPAVHSQGLLFIFQNSSTRIWVNKLHLILKPVVVHSNFYETVKIERDKLKILFEVARALKITEWWKRKCHNAMQCSKLATFCMLMLHMVSRLGFIIINFIWKP